jgi:hypothetical protein
MDDVAGEEGGAGGEEILRVPHGEETDGESSELLLRLRWGLTNQLGLQMVDGGAEHESESLAIFSQLMWLNSSMSKLLFHSDHSEVLSVFINCD